jgi:hypothetical protein
LIESEIAMNENDKKSPLRFDARDLPRSQESIDESDLQEGETYFWVYYLDEKMLIPELTPIVFLGRHLEGDDAQDLLHFQDYDSYRQGVRWAGGQTEVSEVDVTGVHATVTSIKSGESTDVCSYEQALDSLLKCSLRRRSQT